MLCMQTLSDEHRARLCRSAVVLLCWTGFAGPVLLERFCSAKLCYCLKTVAVCRCIALLRRMPAVHMGLTFAALVVCVVAVCTSQFARQDQVCSNEL